MPACGQSATATSTMAYGRWPRRGPVSPTDAACAVAIPGCPCLRPRLRLSFAGTPHPTPGLHRWRCRPPKTVWGSVPEHSQCLRWRVRRTSPAAGQPGSELLKERELPGLVDFEEMRRTVAVVPEGFDQLLHARKLEPGDKPRGRGGSMLVGRTRVACGAAGAPRREGS